MWRIDPAACWCCTLPVRDAQDVSSDVGTSLLSRGRSHWLVKYRFSMSSRCCYVRHADAATPAAALRAAALLGAASSSAGAPSARRMSTALQRAVKLSQTTGTTVLLPSAELVERFNSAIGREGLCCVVLCCVVLCCSLSELLSLNPTCTPCHCDLQRSARLPSMPCQTRVRARGQTRKL